MTEISKGEQQDNTAASDKLGITAVVFAVWSVSSLIGTVEGATGNRRRGGGEGDACIVSRSDTTVKNTRQAGRYDKRLPQSLDEL